MHQEIAPFALLLVVVLLLSRVARFTRRPSPVVSAKPLLSNNEIEFFYRLNRALPDYHVFPQVALGAILQADEFSSRGYFSQKIADFVICEPNTMKVMAVIELDDRTHKVEKMPNAILCFNLPGIGQFAFNPSVSLRKLRLLHYSLRLMVVFEA